MNQTLVVITRNQGTHVATSNYSLISQSGRRKLRYLPPVVTWCSFICHLANAKQKTHCVSLFYVVATGIKFVLVLRFLNRVRFLFLVDNIDKLLFVFFTA